MSELLWVAVPGGRVTGSEAVLRVLVVPRLQVSLAALGIEDWPQRLAGAVVDVLVRTNDGTLLPISSTLHHEARSDVWRAFFGRGMAVKRWRQPVTYPEPNVDPTSEHASGIITTYDVLTKAMMVPGPAGDQTVRQQLARWNESPPAPTSSAASQPAPQWEDPDFHRTLALLREHPSVLRELGLIFDVRLVVSQEGVDPGYFPLPRATAAAPAEVRVHWQGAGIVIASPWTKYQFDGTDFLPASTEDISTGMVDLSGARLSNTASAAANQSGRWEVAAVDVDGGVGRLRDAARSLLARSPTAPAPNDEADRVSLPTLRSAGLMLLRHGRQSAFAGRRRAAAANAERTSMDEVSLTADDLVLGYRIDIRPQGSSEWFSLCRRRATYHVGDVTIGPECGLEEEGHVKAFAATGTADDGALHADEVVARWGGWSLVVPRPPLDDHPNRWHAERKLPLPFDFRWTFDVVPRSLPSLRFGEVYRMRVRVADAAGGGLRLDDPLENTCATELVAYTRYEPVPPPEIPTPAVLGPGSAVDILVIRSDRDMNAATFALQHPQYPSNDHRRDILPPRTTLALAEQHGMLDGEDEQTWGWVRRAMAIPSPGVPPSGNDDALTWLPDPAAGGVTLYLRSDPGELGTTIDSPWDPVWPDYLAKQLQLTEGEIDSKTTMTWIDRQGVVRLAPGRQATVEVSSYLPHDYLDRFAIRDWLPPGAEAAAIGGRHPMVTPARVVRLVHAVRRPMHDPTGSFRTRRNPGETTALLAPTPPLLNLDAPSTMQLDISAAWEEWDSEGGDDGEPVRLIRSTALPPITVERGAESLPSIRHEFGDTKHRKVAYSLTAVSRFRQFFDESEDDEAFRATTKLDRVSVPSSARPAPPVVVSTVPSFRWEGIEAPAGWERLQRSRLGGWLRVELTQPWYTTGEGEQLAVVVWPTDLKEGVPSAVHPFVSSLYRDPIRATPVPYSHPDPSGFVGAARGPKADGRVRLAETGHEVIAVPYEVWYRDSRWYADIGFPLGAASSYCPFAQLALARYQPESLDGLELSPVMRSEMVPLLPDRKLTVERSSGALRVVLEGIGPAGSMDAGGSPGAPPQNRVDVAVERCLLAPGMTVSEVDLTALDPVTDGIPAWTRVPGCAVSGPLNQPLPPLPLPADGDPLRVVVREVEQFEPAPGAPASPSMSAELRERTVFVDVIAIPAAWHQA